MVWGGYKGLLCRVLANKSHQEIVEMDFAELVEDTLWFFSDVPNGFDGRKYARKLWENMYMVFRSIVFRMFYTF